MIGKLSVLLFLTASIVCMTPGDLFGGDPPIGCEPDDSFGDPDDEFQPEENLMPENQSTRDMTTSRSRRKAIYLPKFSDEHRLNFWIHILPVKGMK